MDMMLRAELIYKEREREKERESYEYECVSVKAYEEK